MLEGEIDYGGRNDGAHGHGTGKQTGVRNTHYTERVFGMSMWYTGEEGWETH